jgi:hypothetical protein
VNYAERTIDYEGFESGRTIELMVPTTRKVIASRQKVGRFTQRAAFENPGVIASLPRLVDRFNFRGRPRMQDFVSHGNDPKPTVCRSIGSTANGAWSFTSFSLSCFDT